MNEMTSLKTASKDQKTLQGVIHRVKLGWSFEGNLTDMFRLFVATVLEL